MRISNNKKAQVLLFVIFLLIIVGIIAGGLARMWESEIQIPSLQEYSSQAFYLAQAGIERAKIEVLNGYWAGGTYNINNQEDLDLADDNYQFFYDIEIINPGGGATTRILRGTGRVLDLANHKIARRRIEVTVDGIADIDGDNIDDDPLDNTAVNWSWQEI